ncbi:hypothetical protein [Nocardia altamirensis]|uniref:hypothetical protein n=1 Tax=Nocardia altamirensis TaxID=472158 RepID=UPI00083FDFC5|nr:hypothetical protein [Nocardia altamirensis]
MKLRLPALVAGISVLFITFAVPAHASSPASRAEEHSDEQAEANTKTWSEIVEVWCDNPANPREDLTKARKQMSDKRLIAYYEAYKLSPLDFGTYDRINIARSNLFRHRADWAPPAGSAEPDNIRMWRFLTCTSAESSAEWSNYRKQANEKYGTKLREGFEDDDAILALYDEQMIAMKKAMLDTAED